MHVLREITHKKPTNLERNCGDDHTEIRTAWARILKKSNNNK